MLIPLGFLDFPTGAKDYELLDAFTLGSDTSSITLSGLGDYSQYAHLDLVMQFQADTYADIAITANGDTTSGNYSYHYNGAASGATAPIASLVQSSASMLVHYGATAATNLYEYGSVYLTIYNFADTSKYKAMLGKSFSPLLQDYSATHAGTWRSTSAITSLELAPVAATAKAGTMISIYGWGA